jgi:hypothetical protein
VPSRMLTAQREAGRLDDWKPNIIWLSRALGREIREGEPPAELAMWMLGRERWQRLSQAGEVPADVTEPYAAG